MNVAEDKKFDIERVACPYEECGSSDGFYYSSATKSGFCHVCESKTGKPGKYPRPNFRKDIAEWAEETYPNKVYPNNCYFSEDLYGKDN